MPDLRSPWVNVLAGVVGGVVLGIGLGRMVIFPTVGAIAWTVIGVIILWWALSDRRKFQRNTPESEADGKHTIE